MNYLVLTFLFCLTVSLSYGQNLKVTVKTTDGKPIEKATIRPRFIETGEDGKSDLREFKDKFLVVSKSGFRPFFTKLNGESEIEVALEAENEKDRLTIPECAKKAGGKLVGENLKIIVPKGFKGKKGNDVDYSAFSLFPKNDQKFVLFGISGANASSGYPRDEWINSTDKINIRTITTGKRVAGFDFNGQTKDGKYWRYVQIIDEYISYKVDTAERKNVFDKIIDSGCINPALL